MNTQEVAQARPSQAIAEIFPDPFDPDRSLQLNNKHWPGEKYRSLQSLRAAESALQSAGPAAAARELRHLKEHLGGDRMFGKFLARLHRLWLFRSSFGCVTGRVEIAEDVLKANRYAGNASRASYPLSRADAFARFIRSTADRYKQEYGHDFVRMNCSVRFALPDERQRDIVDHGILSDFHNDEYKGISTIVYLSDVRDENGAFAYIRGSHLIPRSLVLTAAHQVVEFDMGCDNPQKLSHLPLELRGSMAIGNMLEPEKARAVHDRCEVLEGGIGTFVTFDGQYTLHRGGKPAVGSRTAAFFQPEGRLRHKMKSVSSRLFALSHR